MARVPYSGVPDVSAPLEAPQDYQHIEASPASFGAQTAEAVGQVGQDLTKTADFYGKVAADNSTNNFLEGATKLLHGDPNIPGDTGYFGKRGADAMSAREETSQALDELISEQREALSTPEARQQFEVDSRRYRAQYQTQMGTYADEQQKVWATHTNQTSAQLALNDAARQPGNEIAAGAAQGRVRDAYAKNAQLMGEDTQGAVLKADQDVTLARIRSSIVNDPATAQHIFDTQGSVLASLPNYDQISRQVKGAVIDSQMAPATDAFVADTLGRAQGRTGATTGTPSATDISAAIGGQEWHGKGPAPTSVNGAVGPSQILPGTAVRYGLDPTKLNDPAYAAHARDVITQHISALPNVQGDPARIAVGYFSGEGNIAPLGSATPYLQDRADGNGKTTSSYVSDVLGRLQKYPSTADAINANMSSSVDEARTYAEKQWPNYPDVQERFVQGVERRLSQTVAQQHQDYEVATHIVQGAMAGPKPPISEDELVASSPQVAEAWRSMQLNNPMGAIGVERMFDANAKGKAVAYGTDFKPYLDRVLAPATNADRITNAAGIWPYVGQGNDAPLTNTGASALSDLIASRGTPQGEAAASQIKTFVDQMHGQMTYSNPGIGRVDPRGDALFSRYMAQALPIIVKAQQNGTLAQVLDPRSSDYIGNAAQAFMRPQAQVFKEQMQDEAARQMNPPHLPAFTVDSLKRTLDGLDNDQQRQETLKEAVRTKRLSPDVYSAFWRLHTGTVPGQPHNPLSDITVQNEAYPGGKAP